MESKIKYIANKYGKEPQLIMLMEECAELIQACSKQLRRKDKSINHLIEELGSKILGEALVVGAFFSDLFCSADSGVG